MMAVAYEIRLYERCSGNVISTWLGIASSQKVAMVNCVRRCRGKLTRVEANALINKIKYGVENSGIDTLKWAFGIQSDETINP